MITVDGDKYKIAIGFDTTGGSKEVTVYIASNGLKISSGLLFRIQTSGLKRWSDINSDVCIDVNDGGFLVIDGIDLLE